MNLLLQAGRDEQFRPPRLALRRLAYYRKDDGKLFCPTRGQAGGGGEIEGRPMRTLSDLLREIQKAAELLEADSLISCEDAERVLAKAAKRLGEEEASDDLEKK